MNPEEIPVWKPLLRRIPLFKDLAEEVLERVAALMKPLSLPRGATLFNQGDAADAFYVITSGQVHTEIESGGKRRITGTMGRGDTLGELALLTGEPRSFGARLDTTAEFLVLAKADFTTVLRESSDILLQLSRTLSARLLHEARGREQTTIRPRIVALLAPLGEEDRLLFTVQFALALVEQTRSRVLLVDMGEGALFARALGLSGALVGEKALREHDLRDPAFLREFVSPHASGLGVLSLPAKALGGRLYKSIFLLMNLLREHSDLTLVALAQESGDVERSVLYEADRWLLAGTEGVRDAYLRARDALDRFVPEPKSLLEVWLGDAAPLELLYGPGREWTRVAWSGKIADSVRAGLSLFQILDAHPRSRFGVESLARRIARLRVGLALGTGAALGYSLIGILKAFRKAGIPLDVISGTSMGSVIGGLYALGLEPGEIEEIASGVDMAWVWENLFWDITAPRSGFFAGTTLLRFLRSYFEEKTFAQLELPYACVATDIETGEEVVFRSGRVAEAIRASCGIPLIFAPFNYQGRFLVDGGLVDPVPIKVLSQLGADILVAVNLTVPAGERKTKLSRRRAQTAAAPFSLERLKKMALPAAFRSPNLLQIFFQMIYTMEYEIAKSRSSLAHVYIHPDLTGFSWTELHRAKELIRAGESVAESQIPKVKALLPFFHDSCKVDIRKAW